MGDQLSNTRLSHRRVDLRGARYIGGHPQRPRAEATRFLYLTAKGLEFRTGLTPVTIPWDTVTTIVVAGRGELDGWPLVTNDLAQAGGSVAYFRVDAGTATPVFELPGVTPDELRGLLEPVAHLVALPDVLSGPTVEVDSLDTGPSDDVDLDTRQMTALGIEDLVERPAEDTADETPAEDADNADVAEPTTADADADAAVEDEATETAVDEPAAGSEAPDEALEENETDEAEQEPQDEAALGAEAAPDAEPEAEAAPEAETLPIEVTETETVDNDVIVSARDDGSVYDWQADVDTADVATNEVEARWTTETDAATAPGDDVSLDMGEADVELDDHQLTALGMDTPPSENGVSSNGELVAVSDPDSPASATRCPNGHENPEGARFCLQCGAPMQTGCPQGHSNPPGAAFCGECGANLRAFATRNAGEASELELREEAVRVAAETLRRMQMAQEAEVVPLLREVGRISALALDQRVLPLRKSFHEQHITLKRAELALAEAQRDTGTIPGEESDALIELRRIELDFSIQMLLEVTELIALPGNDEEGKELVRQHMGDIFMECDEKRRKAQVALAQVRGEPHAIRVAELENDLAAKAADVRALHDKPKGDAAEVWRVEGELLGLRVTQLTERRAAAIAQADVAATDEAELQLSVARDQAKHHADHAPVQTQKMSRFVAEMMTGMPTVFTGAQRVPRSADRRVVAGKRAVAEFRDFFDTHPAPAMGVPDKLIDQLANDWEEYSAMARQFVSAPMVVQGRSGQRAKIQWIKYDQLILNSWVRRVAVVAAELEVSEAAGEDDRTEGMRLLLEVATEAVRLSSAAAKVEVPTL